METLPTTDDTDILPLGPHSFHIFHTLNASSRALTQRPSKTKRRVHHSQPRRIENGQREFQHLLSSWMVEGSEISSSKKVKIIYRSLFSEPSLGILELQEKGLGILELQERPCLQACRLIISFLKNTCKNSRWPEV